MKLVVDSFPTNSSTLFAREPRRAHVASGGAFAFARFDGYAGASIRHKFFSEAVHAGRSQRARARHAP